MKTVYNIVRRIKGIESGVQKYSNKNKISIYFKHINDFKQVSIQINMN